MSVIDVWTTRWPTRLAASLWMLAACLSNLPDASAQQQKLPAHSHKSYYGNGWQCDPGYRRSGNVCKTIRVPEHAIPTGKSYGLGWECMRGYVAQNQDKCVGILVPKNAYLSASGVGWRCKRGFRRSDDVCLRIVVPNNAFLGGFSYLE